MARAEKEYKDAYEAGEPEKMLEAQKNLQDSLLNKER